MKKTNKDMVSMLFKEHEFPKNHFTYQKVQNCKLQKYHVMSTKLSLVFQVVLHLTTYKHLNSCEIICLLNYSDLSKPCHHFVLDFKNTQKSNEILQPYISFCFSLDRNSKNYLTLLIL